jgi:hypothetical protein
MLCYCCRQLNDYSIKPVPKLLLKVKAEWFPNADLASFKLETDKNLLNTKCKQSGKI